MKRIFISMALVGAVLCANAQTKEELKAQRQEFRSELTSQKTVDRNAKLDELYEKMQTVEETQLNSVDGLANSCKGFLNTVASTNDVLKEYKTEVKDNGEEKLTLQSTRQSWAIMLLWQQCLLWLQVTLQRLLKN